MNSAGDTAEAVGCPIRKSTDQSLLAAPRGLSQRAASFIASQCQGIHQMPFRRLISTYECATRRRKPTRNLPPARNRIRQRCIIMTQPTLLPLPEERPVGLSSVTCSLHMSKIPYPPAGGYLCSLSRISLVPGHQRSLFVTLPSSWWRRTGSNRRPHACKARALPTELRPHGEGSVVGQGRLELPTSRLSSARSNQLSY
jgi:hypothetical protein